MIDARFAWIALILGGLKILLLFLPRKFEKCLCHFDQPGFVGGIRNTFCERDAICTIPAKIV